MEFVRRTDVGTFIRCHLNAFEYFGGVPRRCLYDNAKVVVLGRDEEGRTEWNRRMLDFSLRMGFELRLCRPYRAQTKGKVESGVKYVRNNFWPSARFRDDVDLNNQAVEWCDVVANERVHGTTGRVPKRMLTREREHLEVLPDRRRLGPYLREDRKVGRDGYVHWEGSWYGVPWTWAGRMVQVGVRAGTVEIWNEDERLAVHPRSHKQRQRLTLHGQWAGLVSGDAGRRREALGSSGVVPAGGAAFPKGVRAGRRWRCGMIPLEQTRQYMETLGLTQVAWRCSTAGWMTLPGGSCPTRRCWRTCWQWRWQPAGSGT